MEGHGRSAALGTGSKVSAKRRFPPLSEVRSMPELLSEYGINIGGGCSDGPGCIISDNDSNWQPACALRLTDD